MVARKKLYLIGVDAAPFWLIKRLASDHKMGGFQRFFRQGFLKELTSTVPPVTAAAWPSIYTGLRPQQHGVIDFIHIDREYTKQLIYYDSQKHPPFWEILGEAGIRSLIVTPAMALKLSGNENVDMITGWPLEPKYSSGSLQKAANKFEFRGEPEIGVDLDKGVIPIAEGSKMYVKSIEKRAALSRYLIEKNSYDLVFVCFTETDRIQHYSFNNEKWEQYVAPLYEKISEFVEWVVEQSEKKGEEATIMLVSDHGSQPIYNKFLPNAWLVKNGYAVLKKNITKARKESAKGSNIDVKRYITEKALKMPGRRRLYHLLPGSAKRAIDRMMDDNFTGEERGYVRIKETLDFEMDRTEAFAAVSFGPCGMIWLNDRRFAKPGIREEDRKRVKGEIMSKIGKLEGGDGKRLVKKVFDGQKYYRGGESIILPDILFLLRENYIVDFTYYSPSTIFMKPEIYRSGDHTMEGIFGSIDIGNEKNVKKLSKKKAQVYNIGPTILRYFGYRGKESENSLL
ncbi:MAG: alkaline phosphatase family protein [Candidatus Micrarchaeota archaeon]|nr:alkaline phosphatase family protein [Candidatus Micrarchaeota archaeon]